MLTAAGLAGLIPALLPGFPELPFHICSATACYACFMVCVVGCIGIAWTKKWSPLVPISACEAGLFFAAMTLISGSFWAKSAWGAYWLWEPRLSGMLLMTLFFLSWRLAVSLLGRQAVSNPKLTSSLIVLGLPSMLFTHLAVALFGGIHPASIGTLAHAHGEPWQYILYVAAMISSATGWIAVRTSAPRIPQG